MYLLPTYEYTMRRFFVDISTETERTLRRASFVSSNAALGRRKETLDKASWVICVDTFEGTG